MLRPETRALTSLQSCCQARRSSVSCSCKGCRRVSRSVEVWHCLIWGRSIDSCPVRPQHIRLSAATPLEGRRLRVCSRVVVRCDRRSWHFTSPALVRWTSWPVNRPPRVRHSSTPSTALGVLETYHPQFERGRNGGCLESKIHVSCWPDRLLDAFWPFWPLRSAGALHMRPPDESSIFSPGSPHSMRGASRTHIHSRRATAW